MIYQFEIKEKLPSLNEYTKACRSNKFLGAKMKEDVEISIWGYIKEQLGNTKITEPVQISFTWVEDNKKRDLDNICFAKKFILDALVKSNVLQNDTHKYVTGFSDEFKYEDKPKVIIKIKEI